MWHCTHPCRGMKGIKVENIWNSGELEQCLRQVRWIVGNKLAFIGYFLWDLDFVRYLLQEVNWNWFFLLQTFCNQLRQGLVKGVFLTKVSPPWAFNMSQSIQVFLCSPRKRDLDTWYEAVFALPITCPDIIDIDPDYLENVRPSASFYPHADGGIPLRGGILPQWHLWKDHLWNLGPDLLGLEELLIFN